MMIDGITMIVKIDVFNKIKLPGKWLNVISTSIRFNKGAYSWIPLGEPLKKKSRDLSIGN